MMRAVVIAIMCGLFMLPRLGWAAIAYVNSAQAIGGTDGSAGTLTVSTPSGTVAGNVMLACVSFFQAGSVPTSIPSPFAYANGADTNSCGQSSGDVGVCAYTGVYASGASFSWNYGTNTYVGGIISTYSGVANSSFVDTSAGGTAGTTTTAFSASYSSTAHANEWLATCVGWYNALNASMWSSPGSAPATETARQEIFGVSNVNEGVWQGDVLLASPGSSGSITGTFNSAPLTNPAGGVNVALIPAATGSAGFIVMP